MLALGFGQTENDLTLRTFSVDMCFAVAESVAEQTEKSAKFFVFFSPFGNVSGKDTKENDNDQQNAECQVDGI